MSNETNVTITTTRQLITHSTRRTRDKRWRPRCHVNQRDALCDVPHSRLTKRGSYTFGDIHHALSAAWGSHIASSRTPPRTRVGACAVCVCVRVEREVTSPPPCPSALCHTRSRGRVGCPAHRSLRTPPGGLRRGRPPGGLAGGQRPGYPHVHEVAWSGYSAPSTPSNPTTLPALPDQHSRWLDEKG